MDKIRIVIADTDEHYILPLQLKFIKEYFSKIDLEIITQREYFDQLFSTPQEIDILILSENLYSVTIHKHNIKKIFVMTEQQQSKDYRSDIIQIYKYTNIKEIFNKIMGQSEESIVSSPLSRKGCQVILVDSASGGTGKTTISLGLCACLSHSFKKVLYINVSHLQMPSPLLDKTEYINSLDLYAKLKLADYNRYEILKNYIKNIGFQYLPLFRSSLLSLGINYSIYQEIILSAARSQDYDYIVVDADNVFDENKTKLIELADRVILVTKQNVSSVYSLNTLLENIDIGNSDKYLFVCNDFKENKDNYNLSRFNKARFKINEYIQHLNAYDQMKINDLAEDISIQRLTYLIV